jgi:hypothetical protein
MITVEQCIRELLFEQDCVIIPDFGGFIMIFGDTISNIANVAADVTAIIIISSILSLVK